MLDGKGYEWKAKEDVLGVANRRHWLRPSRRAALGTVRGRGIMSGS